MLYQPQGGSLQNATTSSEGSYTITDLAPATTYTVAVDAQTQLGYGHFCCTPTATTHNGEVPSDAYRGHLLHIIGMRLVLQNWYTACPASVLYTYLDQKCTIYHPFVTQCEYVDLAEC